jgi:hypothetical protein
LQDPNYKCAGKEKEKRRIVNAHVPRQTDYKGSLSIKQATIAKVMSHESKTTATDTTLGMGKHVMIGKDCSQYDLPHNLKLEHYNG